jgi:hypothetical protein
LERAKGIEPSYAAWEAAVLPLNYARLSHVIVIWNFSHAKIKCESETILSRSLARPRLRFNGAERPSCEILSGRHAKRTPNGLIRGFVMNRWAPVGQGRKEAPQTDYAVALALAAARAPV